MVREILGFLFGLAVVAFVLGLALGLYLGVKAGMTMDDTQHAVAAVMASTLGGGGRV